MSIEKDHRARQLRLVDTHCHVDLFPDPHRVVHGAETGQIVTVAVTNIPSVFDQLRTIVGQSRFVKVALGFHPELAVDRVKELPLFRAKVGLTRFIGEVGLDYVTGLESARAIQRKVFSSILSDCDSAGDKILTIHSRRAADDVVDAIGQSFRGRFILHWYSGSSRTLRRALANGAHVSVNSAMTQSTRARAMIADVPQDRLLTETDGPFVRIDERPSQPEDVRLSLEWLSTIWRITLEEASDIVYGNFSRLSVPAGAERPSATAT